jgi:NACalpha-BTF3-like transcription factor
MRRISSKFWNMVKEMSSLTPSRIREIEEVIARLKAKQVPIEEAKKYQLGLEQEKQKALEAGDILVGIG